MNAIPLFLIEIDGHGERCFVALTSAKGGICLTSREDAWVMSKRTAEATLRRVQEKLHIIGRIVPASAK